MLYNTIMEDESAKKVAFNATKERNNLIKKRSGTCVFYSLQAKHGKKGKSLNEPTNRVKSEMIIKALVIKKSILSFVKIKIQYKKEKRKNEKENSRFLLCNTTYHFTLRCLCWV